MLGAIELFFEPMVGVVVDAASLAPFDEHAALRRELAAFLRVFAPAADHPSGMTWPGR